MEDSTEMPCYIFGRGALHRDFFFTAGIPEFLSGNNNIVIWSVMLLGCIIVFLAYEALLGIFEKRYKERICTLMKKFLN